MPKLWSREPELLLLPRIPMPLHGLNPRTLLGNSWWDKVREESYASTNYRCQACGVAKEDAAFKKQLEAHEVYSTNYREGLSTFERVVPLCPNCHQYIHIGRLRSLLDKRVITYQRYSAVVSHGERVLREAGLSPEKKLEHEAYVEELRQEGLLSQWNRWRLQIDARPYRTDVYNVKHKNAPPRSVMIGRTSKWGNPYIIGRDGSRDRVCDLFEKNTLPNLPILELFGKNLLCFCVPERCHGHSILNRLYAVWKFAPLFQSEKDWLLHNQG